MARRTIAAVHGPHGSVSPSSPRIAGTASPGGPNVSRQRDRPRQALLRAALCWRTPRYSVDGLGVANSSFPGSLTRKRCQTSLGSMHMRPPVSATISVSSPWPSTSSVQPDTKYEDFVSVGAHLQRAVATHANHSHQRSIQALATQSAPESGLSRVEPCRFAIGHQIQKCPSRVECWGTGHSQQTQMDMLSSGAVARDRAPQRSACLTLEQGPSRSPIECAPLSACSVAILVPAFQPLPKSSLAPNLDARTSISPRSNARAHAYCQFV